jgi:Gpi18-like mannosyltransferase
MSRRETIAVVLLHVYVASAVILLVHRTTLREDYEEFVVREDGETRSKRLEEIRSAPTERLAPYDGQFYLDIAQNGYRHFETDDYAPRRHHPSGNYAFFPLYPLILRVLAGVFGDPVLPAFVLNVVFSIIGLIALGALAKDLGIAPFPTVLLVVVFPTAIFRFVLYSEALFLALSAGAALAWRRERRGAAVLVATLAVATRPQGVLVPLLFISRPLRETVRLERIVLLALPALGLLGFSLLLSSSIGDPLGFLSIQSEWGRSYTEPTVARLVGQLVSYSGPPFDLVAVLLAFGLLPWIWWRLPLPLALYATGMIALPLASGSILSMGRFLSVSFPHFLVAARLLSDYPRLRALILVSSATIEALLARALLEWHLVG